VHASPTSHTLYNFWMEGATGNFKKESGEVDKQRLLQECFLILRPSQVWIIILKLFVFHSFSLSLKCNGLVLSCKWNISKSADGSVGRNALFDLSHTAILHLHLYRFELGCDFYFWCFPLSNVAEFPVTCPIYIKCCYCDIVSELWPCCWLMLRQCLNISLTECTNIKLKIKYRIEKHVFSFLENSRMGKCLSWKYDLYFTIENVFLNLTMCICCNRLFYYVVYSHHNVMKCHMRKI